MEQTNVSTRIILAFVMEFVVVVITAYLQTKIHFSTYVALAVCLVAACFFFRIINGKE
jgi:hypothetical protein